MTDTAHDAVLGLTAASGDLLAYFQGQRAAMRADVAQARADYEGLGADLLGIVNDQMDFYATIDPSVENPTEVDRGTFNSISRAVAAAPAGGSIVLVLKAGMTHEMDVGIALSNQSLRFVRHGEGEDPVVNFHPFIHGDTNSMVGFTPIGLASVEFNSVTLQLPTEPADPNLPWSAARTVFRYRSGTMKFLGMSHCLVRGGIADEKMGLVSCVGGSPSFLNMYSCELDGPIVGVYGEGNGAHFVSPVGVTLSNDAVLLSADYVNSTGGE